MNTFENFVSKPVIISAMAWTGDNAKELYFSLKDRGVAPAVDLTFAEWSEQVEMAGDTVLCRSATGDVHARVGDYIIFNGEDDVYPCPSETFHQKYQSAMMNLNFGQALAHMKYGGRVARAGWNGKNMFVFLVPGSTFEVNREPLLSILGEGTVVNYHGHIDMRTADGTIVPWLCSQTDALAEDWMIV